jgi:hypothetical protein
MSEHDQSTVENVRDYNRKMIDMAHANAEAAFELARQLAAAKAPSDIVVSVEYVFDFAATSETRLAVVAVMTG